MALGTSASLEPSGKPAAPRQARADERGRARGRKALALAAALVSLAAPRLASAQKKATGALERLEPAPAADGFLTVPEPHVPGDFRPGVAMAFSFASSPLVVEVTSGGETREVAVLSHQATLHTLLSLEILKTVKLDINVPLTITQGGETLPPEASRFPVPTGPSFNDLRAGARVELFHQRGSIPSVALAMGLWVPTGNEHELAGAGSLRYAPSIIVGGTSLRYLWSVMVGRRFQSESPDALFGSELLLGAAAGFRFGPFQVGAEIFGATVADARVSAFSGDTTGLEALGTARVAFGSFTVGGGVGVGLTDGFGTPGYRMLGSLAYAPPAPKEWPTANVVWGDRAPGETEGDKANDKLKPPKKPDAKGIKAAPPDKDGDAVPDADDACPDLAGAPGDSDQKRGCPPDKDGDGIIDADDRCPGEVGGETPDPSRVGCPVDSDDDGINDRFDGCPSEKGPKSDKPATNGCPTALRIEGQQIVLLQQIHFVSGGVVLDPESEEILNELAVLLRDHPEIARVAIDGHTDDAGSEAANIALSQRRAVAVMQGLIRRGVDPRRLEARGFGPRRPLERNDTPEGRAKNRRVEFQIRKKTSQGEAGWVDGPIE
jgi:outer membrane protein OmpA-like peptidoglycan-associated protein